MKFIYSSSICLILFFNSGCVTPFEAINPQKNYNSNTDRGDLEQKFKKIDSLLSDCACNGNKFGSDAHSMNKKSKAWDAANACTILLGQSSLALSSGDLLYKDDAKNISLITSVIGGLSVGIKVAVNLDKKIDELNSKYQAKKAQIGSGQSIITQIRTKLNTNKRDEAEHQLDELIENLKNQCQQCQDK